MLAEAHGEVKSEGSQIVQVEEGGTLSRRAISHTINAVRSIFSCELLGGSLRKGSVGSRWRHRPDCSVPEHGGPEDVPLCRSIDNATDRAPGLFDVIGDRSLDRVELLDVWI